MMPSLLVLTDRTQLPPGRTLITCVAECVAAGATTVVLRELDLPTSERAALAAALIDVGATVISAHVLLPGCAAVHLPAAGAAVAGPFGRSCHSAAEVRAAAREGADWVTLSPFAASASKPGYGPAVRRSEYADAPVPIYALGGITAVNALEALTAGAHGVAVVGAVMRAPDPAAVVTALLECA